MKSIQAEEDKAISYDLGIKQLLQNLCVEGKKELDHELAMTKRAIGDPSPRKSRKRSPSSGSKDKKKKKKVRKADKGVVPKAMLFKPMKFWVTPFRVESMDCIYQLFISQLWG